MSDETPKGSDAIKEFEAQFAEERKYDAIKKETSRKKILLDKTRVDAQLDRQKQDEEDFNILKKANFGRQTDDQIAAIIKDNQDYIDAARKKLDFITDSRKSVEGTLVGNGLGFDVMVPFFRKNLILIGAQTGDGKSTAVANIAFNLMFQKNPVTGKPARILVLTNEERKEDVYNRITCILNGWNYTNHDKFTDEQIEKFNKSIPALASRITVIDNVHEGAHGATTSLEGLECIFEGVAASDDPPDAIVLDYYQNVITSKRDPTLDEWKVQARLSRVLDNYKNILPCPIIVLSQVNGPDEKGNPIFFYRIQGRKIIMTVCTCAIEMIVNKKHRVTEWKCWKSRFNECIGESVLTGYDKGRFVPYTEEFKAQREAEVEAYRAKVAEREAQREQKELDRQLDQESGQELKKLQEEAKSGPTAK
jgi:hypothetical protein